MGLDQVNPRFASEAYLATQHRGIKHVVQDLCDMTGLHIEQITNPKTEFQKYVQRALVCKLGMCGLELRKIEDISGMYYLDALQVLRERRRPGVAVRTSRVWA